MGSLQGGPPDASSLSCNGFSSPGFGATMPPPGQASGTAMARAGLLNLCAQGLDQSLEQCLLTAGLWGE